jgi:hypothetical protein
MSVAASRVHRDPLARSARLDGAASELIVRSDQSVQSNPHTVAEVRRILLLHLAEVCPQGCAPATTTDPLPLAAANGPGRRQPGDHVGMPTR